MKDLEKVLKAKNEIDIKAAKDDFKKRIIPMLKAQEKAEKAGQFEFICPLCKGTVTWNRSTYNNHLHIYCSGCGFKMME